VRIAPNEYSIDDPEAAKIIYGSGKGFRKVRTIIPNVPNRVFERN